MDIETIRGLVADWGLLIYAGIFIWTFFEGETFVIFMGMAAHHGLLDWTAVFMSAWIGSFCGDQCWFWIGRRWGGQLLLRYPKWRGGVETALDLLRQNWQSRLPITVVLSTQKQENVRFYTRNGFAMHDEQDVDFRTKQWQDFRMNRVIDGKQ